MFYPCLFCPSDNVWCSRRADAPRCAHFYTVITPSWITQQISIENCAHRGKSVRRERQTMLKSVTWTKQTWTTQHRIRVCHKRLKASSVSHKRLKFETIWIWIIFTYIHALKIIKKLLYLVQHTACLLTFLYNKKYLFISFNCLMV